MIIATHVAIHSCYGLFYYPGNFLKHALVDTFLFILHSNNIGHLLKTSRGYFRPPPKKKSFRKEMDNSHNIYIYIFMYIFEKYLLSFSYF